MYINNVRLPKERRGEKEREGERGREKRAEGEGSPSCTDVHRLHAPAPAFPLTRLGYGSSSGESRAFEDG